MKKLLIIVIVLIIVGAGVIAAYTLGYIPFSSSLPEQVPADTVDSTVTTTKNLRAVSVASGAKITSPLTITGEARGWYFEASFPIELRDEFGTVIASGPAQAQGDWMTSEFVPFKATLTFKTPKTAVGLLILRNDNPSGLPENDQRVLIPVTFAMYNYNPNALSLFYPNIKKASEIGDPCSVGAIQPITREFEAPSKTPIQDAINLLIAGNLTSAEKTAGFSTEFPHKDFKLKGVNLKEGNLTLEFTTVPGFTTGGSCRTGLLAEQITRTAKQFPSVQTVTLKPDTLFQP